VHFATPEAAMRYLAGAYNRNDLAAPMHVTTPAARHHLLATRADATIDRPGWYMTVLNDCG
jgi:hypothetical protein